MPNPKALIDIVAKTRGFDSGMNRVQRILGKVRQKMEAVSRAAKVLLAGQVLLGGKLIALASKQEAEEAKLARVLEATGHAAGLSAEQLKKHASELQRLTGVGDEAILGLQAILATFRNIKGDTFKDATALILDMAVVMETDAKSAALQLGKALNDPILGVTALGRAGVQFNAQQKDVIKSLVESGQLYKAQALILGELESQVGGVAKALGDTTQGQLNKFKSALGDLGESIGAAIIPPFIGFIITIRESIESAIGWVKEHEQMVRTIVAVGVSATAALASITLLTGGLKVLAGTAALVSGAVGLIATPVGAAVAALTALGAAIAVVLVPGENLKEKWESIKTTFTNVTGAMAKAWDWVVDKLAFGLAFTMAAFSNWSDTLRAAILQFTLNYVTAFNDLIHFLAVVIPEWLGFFLRNWKEILTDVGTFAITVLANMTINFENFFKFVLSWLKGEKSSFEWTALTTGFEATLKEDFPKIAKRQLTDTEKWLQKEIDKSMGGVWKKARENYNRFRKWLDDRGKEVEDKVEESNKKREKIEVEPEDKPEKEKKAPEQSRGPTFESVVGAFQRIAEAAASRNKAKGPEDKTAANTQAIKEEGKRQTTEQKNIAKTVKDIGAEIVEAITNQNPNATLA